MPPVAIEQILSRVVSHEVKYDTRESLTLQDPLATLSSLFSDV
jgi:hypothetical protein